VPDLASRKYAGVSNSRGCFRENEELFNDTSWFAVMTGQLMRPRTFDPVARLLSAEETKSRLDHIQSAVIASAEYMPKHRDFINEHCAA